MYFTTRNKGFNDMYTSILKINESHKFYIGLFLIAIGVVYTYLNLNKENDNNEDWLKKVDITNSWVIAIVLIAAGIIMLF